MTTQQQTYYEILELTPTCAPIDIKKAYRRLALKYHPDRNNGSAESTEKFQLIGEAYEVLSDERRRREYDLSLKEPSFGYAGGGGATAGGAGVGRYQGQYGAGGSAAGRRTRPGGHPFADPYRQFDDLFRNDPFFNEAFRDMDDEFARRFRTGGGGGDGERGAAAGAAAGRGQKPTVRRQGWLAWIADCLGVQLTMTTVTHGPGGTVSASSYNSRPGNGGGYTDRRTRTFIENGRRVTVRSMEKDGNRIEDKYVEGTLVERKVNGVVEPVGRIGDE